MIKTALGTLLLLVCPNLFAQVSISSVNYNTVSLNESNLLQAVVSNSGAPVTANALVTCKNAAGEIIIEAASRSFTLNAGINSVNGISIGFSRFTYGNSGKALYLKNNGMLAAGNYTYCIKITPVGMMEDGDIYCEEFEANTDDFLNLIIPYDGDTLDTKLPLLTWTHSEPFNVLAPNEYFKLVLTELKPNQNADQAVFANPAIYTKNYLNTHSIPYPPDAQELQDGKGYAWQVQKFANNIMVNKTDAWQFFIPKKRKKPDNKYALMKEHYDASYYTSYNEKIFFQFEETYSGKSLVHHIYNAKRDEIKINVKHDTDEKVQINIKQQGSNLYELDLSPYNLKTGYYFLEIADEKGRKTVLKFYVD